MLREMIGDETAGFRQRGTGGVVPWVEKDQYRGAGAAQDGSENAGLTFELLQAREQRTECGAIGLVDAVFESRGEKIGSALGEGGEQEHGILHVEDGVGARILRGQDEAGFFGGEAFVGHGQQERPLALGTDAGDFGLGNCIRHAGDGEAAHPAGGGVVGVVLAAGSFADDLRVGPAQAAEVDCESNARQVGGSGRAAAFADGDVVVDFERQRLEWAGGRLQDFAVGVEDEVVFDAIGELAADFAVAAAGGDEEFLGGAGFEFDVEIHGERGRVEGGAEIGGGRGEREAEAFRVWGFGGHVQCSVRLWNPPGAKALFLLQT